MGQPAPTKQPPCPPNPKAGKPRPREVGVGLPRLRSLELEARANLARPLLVALCHPLKSLVGWCPLCAPSLRLRALRASRDYAGVGP